MKRKEQSGICDDDWLLGMMHGANEGLPLAGQCYESAQVKTGISFYS